MKDDDVINCTEKLLSNFGENFVSSIVMMQLLGVKEKIYGLWVPSSFASIFSWFCTKYLVV